MSVSLIDISREHLNQEIRITLLLTDVKVKVTRSGKRYADLMVQDQTHKCEVRFWDYDQQESVFQEWKYPVITDFVLQVGEYREQIQLTAKECQLNEDPDIKIDQLVQTSRWNPEKMKAWLKDYYDFIQAPHIKVLVEQMVFAKPYYDLFCTYPAAKTVHHNFRYGILQHTLEVLKYVKMVASTKHLSQRQQDRLLAMTFLHDWAKIMEYEPVPSESLTVEGRMLGHIFIGAHYTQSTIDQIEGFDQEDALVIMNGILGHHGAYEWGSPVLPKTVEAQILHQADKLSGDIESILSFMDRQQSPEHRFTDRLWNMGTEYFKGGLE